MSPVHPLCRRRHSWRPKKRYLALAFLVAAAAYQAHVQWASIKHALSAIHEIIDTAMRNKIITTDRQVQDRVRKELAPLLKRIEQLERAQHRAAVCTCDPAARLQRYAPQKFKFPTTIE